MTNKEIRAGLRFRLDNLRKSYETVSKEQDMEYIQGDYEARIDELESFSEWIGEDFEDEK